MNKRKITLAILCLFSLILIQSQPVGGEGLDENIPDWLKRFEYSLQLETEQKPVFYFQTVQPLYQDDEKINNVFIQPRVNLRHDKTTYNLGVGYRRLMSEDLLLGINVFTDFQDPEDHARAGVGLEALGQIFEGRFNSYFPVTGKRIINVAGNTVDFEKVAEGVDYEIGAPLPYLPWLKLYGSGFWYNFRKFDDKKGWKSRLEASLNDNLKLEFYVWDDNKGDTEYGGRLRYTVAFESLWDIKDSLRFSNEPYPEKDLREDVLIPVERDFNITVEAYTESNGMTVEAGRS